MTGNKSYFRGGRYRQVSLYFFRRWGGYNDNEVEVVAARSGK